MANRQILFTALALISLALIGCGGDDDPTVTNDDPTPTDVDELAPLVVHFEPSGDPVILAVDAVLAVQFSEAMDPATAAGQIALSAGEITTTTWNSENTRVEIAHSDWAAGATITLTVGEAMTDVAGNALPRAFAATFYTETAAPVMLETRFGDPTLPIPTNLDPVMLFSMEMDLQSVYDATTITDDSGSKAVPAYQIGTVLGDYRLVKIRFLADLTPETNYHVSISTGAFSRGDEIHLPAAVEFDFATGLGPDEAAPYIVSTVPAIGTTVDPELAEITVQFSEPIDPNRIRPDRMSAILDYYVAREPAWNDAGDELTLYLQHALPAGVRLFAFFEANGFFDRIGNGNDVPDSLSFFSAGQAEWFPVDADVRLYYDDDSRVTFDEIQGDAFEKLTHRRVIGGAPELDNRWLMRANSSGLFLRGFEIDTTLVLVTPEVAYLPTPIPETWEGTSTGSMGQSGLTLGFSGELTESGHIELWRGWDKDTSTTQYICENSVRVLLIHEITAAGDDSPFLEGEELITFCPGLGIVEVEYDEYNQDTGESDEGYYRLEAIAWDDRWID